ncbi:unnamed protein product [Auanema sp. JU1783]|nr:unnamed protein product [Auanema sp. JU1783]
MNNSPIVNGSCNPQDPNQQALNMLENLKLQVHSILEQIDAITSTVTDNTPTAQQKVEPHKGYDTLIGKLSVKATVDHYDKLKTAQKKFYEKDNCLCTFDHFKERLLKLSKEGREFKTYLDAKYESGQKIKFIGTKKYIARVVVDDLEAKL